MRKKLVILLTLILATSMAGCSGSSKLNDNNTRTAKAVINAVDAYLDGTADLRTTYNLVQSESGNIDEDDESDGALSFKIDLPSLCIQLNPALGANDVSKIIDYRDDIASLIGESKYK